MIEARPVADDGELEQILDLQRRNLARNLSEREMAESGFVTVEHTLDLLRRMHCSTCSTARTANLCAAASNR